MDHASADLGPSVHLAQRADDLLYGSEWSAHGYRTFSDGLDQLHSGREWPAIVGSRGTDHRNTLHDGGSGRLLSEGRSCVALRTLRRRPPPVTMSCINQNKRSAHQIRALLRFASKYAATSDGRREMYQGAINSVLAMFDACRGTRPTDETSLICDERDDCVPRDLTIA